MKYYIYLLHQTTPICYTYDYEVANWFRNHNKYRVTVNE